MKVIIPLSELIALCDWAEDQYASVGDSSLGDTKEAEVVIDFYEKRAKLIETELGEISRRPLDYFKNLDDYLA